MTFAIDEVISPLGYREAVTSKEIQKFTEMESPEGILNKIIETSKIHKQQQFLAGKAKSFDDMRLKARAVRGDARTRFPGSDCLFFIFNFLTLYTVYRVFLFFCQTLPQYTSNICLKFNNAMCVYGMVMNA